jgi:hypothetical protein
VNANFSLSAIVAQLMPSSMSASVAPPCTYVGAPENSAPSVKSANTTPRSVSCENGTCIPRAFAGSQTKQLDPKPQREFSSRSTGMASRGYDAAGAFTCA